MKSSRDWSDRSWFVPALAGVFWLLVLVLYFPGRGALLLDDGISGLWELQTQGLQGYLQSYGSDSFYYGHYALLALLYTLFGLNPLGWFLLFTAMHAANATAIFVFLRRLLGLAGSESTAMPAFFSALFMLLSPYQVENVLWAATIHYAFTLAILLWMLNRAILWLSGEGGEPRWIIFHGLFALALVTLEMAFLFPVLCGMLTVLLMVMKKNVQPFKQIFLRMWLPMAGMVLLYLIAYFLQHGEWIPHDRAPQDAEVTPGAMLTMLAQQLMKLYGHIHSFAFPTRESVYGLAVHWKRATAAILVFFALGLLIIRWRTPSRFLPALWMVCTGLFLYLPFLRLYFMYLFRYENDRYAYFPSVFLLPFLVLLIAALPRVPRLLLWCSVPLLYVWLLRPAVKARAMAADLHRTWMSRLPDTARGNIYLLNVPSYCADVYMFRGENRLPIAYEATHRRNLFKNLRQVAWYNAQGVHDTVEVKKLAEGTYEVLLKTGGSWWMKGAGGLGDEENDDYALRLGPWSNYTLTFKHPLHPGDAVYYFNGRRFVSLR
jgi:hypothetical protein